MKKLKAQLVGGPLNGEIIEMDEVVPTIKSKQQILRRTGDWQDISEFRYNLQSKNPLRYVFSE
jgi:hypothetical protein